MKLFITLMLVLLIGSANAADISEIEKRRLFEPTEAEVNAEAAGRIYIYEGLSGADIARAMDEEFERVENMMFIRIKKTDENGEVMTDPDTGEALVEDDGC
jgi:hypothetical protein